MRREDADKNHCRYHEWDECSFVLPNEYCLSGNDDLADALRVFYQAGGYDFFNVVNPEHYASRWLEFVGDLLRAIMEGRYTSAGKRFTIPLSEAQRKELAQRNVPEIFISDIR